MRLYRCVSLFIQHISGGEFGCCKAKYSLHIEQDSAGLTQLSSTMEDVFSSGDLPRAAETLANMRHCSSTIGEMKCWVICMMHELFQQSNLLQSLKKTST